MNKDVHNTADVQLVINAMDAYHVARVTTNDPSYIPSIQSILAMDVNRDRVISAGDISQINQRTVGARDEFALAIGSGRDWLFLDAALPNQPAYRASTTWPGDDGTGYSRHRVPRPSQAFNVPLDPISTLDCPVISDKTYQAIMLGDADGSYKNFSYSALPIGVKSASSEEINFNIVKSPAEVEVVVSFKSETPIVAVDASFVAGGLMSSYSLSGEGMCFQRGEKVSCTSYSLSGFQNDNVVMKIEFNKEYFESIDVQNTLLNGKPVDFNVEYTEILSSIDNNSIAEIQVYPNPAYDELNVVFEDEAEISIFNVTGELILNTKAYNGFATIEVDEFTAGIYQVVVVQEENVQTTSVVIE
jgi:hypothetical protein